MANTKSRAKGQDCHPVAEPKILLGPDFPDEIKGDTHHNGKDQGHPIAIQHNLQKKEYYFRIAFRDDCQKDGGKDGQDEHDEIAMQKRFEKSLADITLITDHADENRRRQKTKLKVLSKSTVRIASAGREFLQ